MDPTTRRRLVLALLATAALVVAAPQVRAQEAFFSSLEIEGDGMRTTVHGLSGDGAVPVGTGFRRSQDKRWPVRLTAETGFEKLGKKSAVGSTAAWDGSADGSVVVGNHDALAFRWTTVAGFALIGVLPGFGASEAKGVSDDGLVVCGTSWKKSFEQFRAFRWTQDSAMQDLGSLSGDGMSIGTGTSGDGSVIVGWSENPDSRSEAFRWTEAGGMQGLGFLPGEGRDDSAALAASLDGSVVVGVSGTGGVQGREAFSWTAATGMIALGDLAGGRHASRAQDVSADGVVIVGYGENQKGRQAVAWVDGSGPQRIKKLLRATLPEADFEADVAGWRLYYAVAVSDDGATIVGSGTNPSGKSRSWIAHLPELAAPAN